MDLGLSNLSALVTGASRGLGYATALALAREGAKVALNSRSSDACAQAVEKIAAETGAQVVAVPGDVALENVPEQIVARTAEQFGGLDLLLTNSGGPPAGRFENIDDAAWLAAIQSNPMAHVRLIRAALPHLRRSKAASVLAITSYGVKQPLPNLVLSNSLRLATIGLTKSLALELGGDGIRFNAILPAWTKTERVRYLMEARAKITGATVEEEYEKQAKESPLGRIGEPEEFAKAAVFLLSPAASYITGLMLSFDGGMYKGTL